MSALSGKRRRRNRPRRVTASQLAQLGYCEIKLVMDARHGERVTPQQVRARKGGNAEHAKMDRLARRFHNQGLGRPRRGPCFVATQVYGSDDPRTNELRRFRDRVLRRTRLGRSAIAVYYRHSPRLCSWAARHPPAVQLMRRCLDATRWAVGRWTRGTS